MSTSRSNILIGVVVALAVAAAIIVILRVATTKEEKSSLGKVFTYDVTALRKTDPALIKYEESGRIDTEFQAVFAVAVDSSDRIYVAGDTSIQIFDSEVAQASLLVEEAGQVVA